MLWKRIGRKRWAQQVVGYAAAQYLRAVASTSRFVVEPADVYERIEPDMPIILAMWHGQHFLVPFARKPEHRAKVLISMHRDGEINAIVAERLGIGTIRGSGAIGGDFVRKGGLGGFSGMMEALEQGYSIAMTADVPKVSRRAGLGIVKLAQLSGRPIYPLALATSRRIELDNWDRTAVNLPFSRLVVVVTEPVRVPADADADGLEEARQTVEQSLNAATQRAYALADRGRADAAA